MKTPWLWAGALLAWLVSGSVSADSPYGARSGGNWRSPPPAWGYPPGATPYGNFRRPSDQGGWHDGRGRQYDDYRRDRQRWRDDPYDRHESNRRHDRRDDWRGGNAYGDQWRRDRRDDRRQRGLIQSWPDERRYPPPAYGPYAPRPYRDYRGYDDGRY